MGQKQKQRTDEYNKRVQQNSISTEVLIEVALLRLKENIQNGVLVPYTQELDNITI